MAGWVESADFRSSSYRLKADLETVARGDRHVQLELIKGAGPGIRPPREFHGHGSA